MSAAEALKAAKAAGTRVGIDGDDLVLEASAPPPRAVLDILSRHKADIVTLLQRQGQEPRISHVCEASLVITGSRVTISWPDSACSILDDAQAHFLQIAENYTWANPHLTLSVTWDRGGYEPIRWTIAATDPAWRKWGPSDPTSPHWYDEGTARPAHGRLYRA